MSTPLVSILLPVYNVGRFIERCARSVFEQTYDNLEYIFVDDNSTDDSIDILKKVLSDYPQREKKTHIIVHNQNKGLAAARNSALASCHGDFVFHVDSDDWIEPSAVELLVKKQQETGADIVYTTGYYKHEKSGLQENYCHGWSSDKDSILTNMLQDKATICMWSKLINKRLYTDNSITCDECGNFYEDFQVLTRLIYYSKAISGIDAIVYHYNRQNPNSLAYNLSKNVEIQKQGLVSIEVVCNFFRDKELAYYDLAQKFYRNYAYKMLDANRRHGNKKGYNEFLKALN